MSWEHKFANIYKEMYASGEGGMGGGGGAAGYCSNYYENQSNKLETILNQSTYCYSFSSISKKKKNRNKLREPWSTKMSQKSLTTCYYQSDFLSNNTKGESELSWDYIQCYEHFRHILLLHDFLSLTEHNSLEITVTTCPLSGLLFYLYQHSITQLKLQFHSWIKKLCFSF